MKFIDRYNCILCRYNKYNKNGDNCMNHREKDEYGYPLGECKSLSNIYYGTIVKFFPFKQIYNFATELSWLKENKYLKKMDEKYGDYSLENDDMKFIWGVKSWDDLTTQDANLYSMNDLSIVYDKEKKEYMLGIETIYFFNNKEDEIKYLEDLLDKFTEYVKENKYMINRDKMCLTNVESSEPWRAETISELYIRFKIFVNGFKSVFGE